MRTPPFKISIASGNAKATANGTCPRCGFVSAFFSAQAWPTTDKQQTYESVMSFGLTCMHCSRAILVDAKPYNPGEKLVAVYPGTFRRFPYDGLEHVDKGLRAALTEAYRAFGADAYTLAGLGCRVVLERLVQGKGLRDVGPDDLGAPKADPDWPRSLEARLERLKDLFPDLVGPLVNADIIRRIGNAAAHDAFKEISRDQALAAIEFTEDVLRAVYIAPKRREAMEKAFPEEKAPPAPAKPAPGPVVRPTGAPTEPPGT